MKVLAIGATGNLGSRLVPALLTHGHTVVAYVRSASKLESILPTATYQKITVVQGNATDSIAIKKAILDNKCDAIVNTAGLAAMPPWGKSDLPAIFRAVLDGVQSAAAERKKPLRFWFLGGMGVLSYPGTDTMLSDYIPVYLEHRQNLKLVKSIPPNTVDWSMLCPAVMTPESEDLSVPTKLSRGKLIATAGTLPSWQKSWLESIPFVGQTILLAMSVSRYDTTLEQAADLIAGDLETRDSQWSGATVGIIDPAK